MQVPDYASTDKHVRLRNVLTTPGTLIIPAEEHTGSRIRTWNNRAKRYHYEFFPLQVWQGVNRYLYTHPPPDPHRLGGPNIEWAYEVTPVADTVAVIAIATSETAWEWSPGTGGPGRYMALSREVDSKEDFIGEFAGTDTGGWENFVESRFTFGLKKGFVNRLILRTVNKGNQIYPIPHVLYVRVTVPLEIEQDC